MEIPARQRFQRYRGLRSFRTSPWDPYESLPLDYARIFQFEDYKRTERAVKRRAEEEVATVQVSMIGPPFTFLITLCPLAWNAGHRLPSKCPAVSSSDSPPALCVIFSPST